MKNIYKPYLAKILQVTKHTPKEYTFTLEYKGEALVPGQFFEISLPKYGEAPISVSGYTANTVDFTIRSVGQVTDEVFNYQVGQSLFIRGPYGNGFDLDIYKNKELLIVAGGTGLSPVRGVVDYFSKNYKETRGLTLIAGFKEPKDILFLEDIANWKKNSNIILTAECEDENIECALGLVTQHIPNLEIKEPEKALAIVVGPPIMIKFSIISLLEYGFNKENIWLSYERKMCCGLGKCGHCKINDTYVCLEGPVFNYLDSLNLID